MSANDQEISALPLNDLPVEPTVIVLAVCKVVAVPALPVVDAELPVTLMPQLPDAPLPVRDGAYEV